MHGALPCKIWSVRGWSVPFLRLRGIAAKMARTKPCTDHILQGETRRKIWSWSASFWSPKNHEALRNPHLGLASLGPKSFDLVVPYVTQYSFRARNQASGLDFVRIPIRSASQSALRPALGRPEGRLCTRGDASHEFTSILELSEKLAKQIANKYPTNKNN
jgi:hypothetical protein